MAEASQAVKQYIDSAFFELSDDLCHSGMPSPSFWGSLAGAKFRLRSHMANERVRDPGCVQALSFPNLRSACIEHAYAHCSAPGTGASMIVVHHGAARPCSTVLRMLMVGRMTIRLCNAARVLVLTSDGRCYVGTLKACDQATNLVLDQAVERIYSTDVRFTSPCYLLVRAVYCASAACI